jgi:hypothetical protein
MRISSTAVSALSGSMVGADGGIGANITDRGAKT